jgi:DNA-binding NarL/FixJ family response regulator
MGVRVILADDHEIVRNGLRALLEREQDVEVVAEAQDGRTAADLVGKLSPDVVVMDISMPDLNGIEATRQITTKCPATRIIALSVHSDCRFVVEMFKAGASGYLVKDCAYEELIYAIHTVMQNRKYLSPRIAHVLVESCVQEVSRPDCSVYTALTPRQREVLQHISEGWSTKNIAAHLKLSVKTVEAHRRQIMNKLDIHNIAELTKFAIREGLTSLET